MQYTCNTPSPLQNSRHVLILIQTGLSHNFCGTQLTQSRLYCTKSTPIWIPFRSNKKQAVCFPRFSAGLVFSVVRIGFLIYFWLIFLSFRDCKSCSCGNLLLFYANGLENRIDLLRCIGFARCR